MDSRIYVGTVAHQRLRPKRNSFEYGIWFLYLDLDELAELDRTLKLFGHNDGKRVRLYDRDHGPRDGTALRPWIDGVLAQAGVHLEGGRVRLLTFARAWGFSFFPASFWYCFHADGTLRAILVEVNNTFGGHHDYLLHDSGEPLDLSREQLATKVFHVSPFIAMDARYRFRFVNPAESLHIRIHDDVEGELLLVAGVDLNERPLTDAELRRVFRRFGPMPLRAATLILWQALRLIAKGMRLLPNPGPPKEEVSL